MRLLKQTAIVIILAVFATFALARSEGLYNPSSNSVGDYQGIDSNKASGGAAPLTLNGTPQTANSGASAALALPAFTAPASNNVVVVAIESNATPSGGHAVTSVTGGGLTFAAEPGLTPPQNGGSTLEVWTAIAASPVSGVVFTVNTATSAFVTAIVFAVNGAKTSAPFDVGGPTTAVPPAPYATVNTTSANTFAFGMAANNASTPANGYTNMSATALTSFLLLDYKIVSAPQSGVVFDTATPAASLTTAFVQGP